MCQLVLKQAYASHQERGRLARPPLSHHPCRTTPVAPPLSPPIAPLHHPAPTQPKNSRPSSSMHRARPLDDFCWCSRWRCGRDARVPKSAMHCSRKRRHADDSPMISQNCIPAARQILGLQRRRRCPLHVLRLHSQSPSRWASGNRITLCHTSADRSSGTAGDMGSSDAYA